MFYSTLDGEIIFAIVALTGIVALNIPFGILGVILWKVFLIQSVGISSVLAGISGILVRISGVLVAISGVSVGMLRR